MRINNVIPQTVILTTAILIYSCGLNNGKTNASAGENSQQQTTPIYEQPSETVINAFLQWKLDPKRSAETSADQKNLPIELVSHNLVPSTTLSNQTIKLYKLDLLLTKEDIDTMNQQIKHWNSIKVWDKKTYKFPFINPDTLSNPGKQFLELSIPVFSKNKQVCLLQSNINCHENYCHDEMLAIYQKQNGEEWKIIKVLHHSTY